MRNPFSTIILMNYSLEINTYFMTNNTDPKFSNDGPAENKYVLLQ